MGRKVRIGTLIAVASMSVILLLALTFLTLGLYHSRRAFEIDQNGIYDQYIQSEKRLIETTANQVYGYTQSMANQTTDELKALVKSRVNAGRELVTHLYKENKGTMTPDELVNIIREALRPIRFDSGNGYYFMDKLDGSIVLYPVLPELEGTNAIDLQDGYGNFVLRDEIALVRQFGNGYVEGYWGDPAQSGDLRQKISYVQLIKPLDMYLGTGIYVDQFVRAHQQTVLTRMQQYFKGGDAAYGVYILDQSGQTLLSIDPNQEGVGVSKGEAVAVAQRNDIGSFLTYEVDSAEKQTGYAFVKRVPEWDWTVVVVSDLPGLQTLLTERYDQYVETQTLLIIQAGGIIALVLFLTMMIVRVVNRRDDLGAIGRPLCEQCRLKVTEAELKPALHTDPQGTNETYGPSNALESLIEENPPDAYDVEQDLEIAESMVSHVIESMQSIVIHPELREHLQYRDAVVSRLLLTQEILKKKLQKSDDEVPGQLSLGMINLNDAIREVFELVQSEYTREVHLQLHCDETFYVCTDAMILTQVFTHMLAYTFENGFDQEEKPSILIEAMYDDDWYRIVYRDNGRGLPLEVQEKLFEPEVVSQSIPNTLTLGLLSARKLVVSSLKGTMNLIPQDDGIHFVIDLPRFDENDAMRIG